jgi:hypothetical protein
MAAGTWKIYARAKRGIGAASINLTGAFRLCLLHASASATILKLASVSTWGSISTFAISARGGYQASGETLGGILWTAGASAKQMKFTYTTAGHIFTASGSTLGNTKAIKYAVIRNSTGANAGKLLCFCTLSATGFTISSPNTLTILPAATGVFTLA